MSNDPSAGIIALLVLLVLALIMRWVFKPSRPRTGPIPDASDARELGLLTVVRTAVPREEALVQRARLGEAGIRSSMSKRKDGLMDVLVFHGDVDQAMTLLG